MVDLWASSLETVHKPKELLAMLKQHDIGVSSIYHMTKFDYENENVLKLMREDTKKRIKDCNKIKVRRVILL